MKSPSNKDRYNPEVERGLRQFITDGPKGATESYKRGWEFNFSFTDEQRNKVLELQELGMSFEEAFDKVKGKA